jgi:hypothetical protein
MDSHSIGQLYGQGAWLLPVAGYGALAVTEDSFRAMPHRTEATQDESVEQDAAYASALMMTQPQPRPVTVAGNSSALARLSAQKRNRLGQMGARDSTRAARNAILPSEWAARRGEITELYRHRGWTLPRVMEEMAARGFVAS